MPVPKTAQISEALLANDPDLAKFRKDPKGILMKTAKIDISNKQAAAVKVFMSDLDKLSASFGKDEVGAWSWAKWKRVLKAAGALIVAIAS